MNQSSTQHAPSTPCDPLCMDYLHPLLCLWGVLGGWEWQNAELGVGSVSNRILSTLSLDTKTLGPGTEKALKTHVVQVCGMKSEELFVDGEGEG